MKVSIEANSPLESEMSRIVNLPAPIMIIEGLTFEMPTLLARLPVVGLRILPEPGALDLRPPTPNIALARASFF